MSQWQQVMLNQMNFPRFRVAPPPQKKISTIFFKFPNSKAHMLNHNIIGNIYPGKQEQFREVRVPTTGQRPII